MFSTSSFQGENHGANELKDLAIVRYWHLDVPVERLNGLTDILGEFKNDSLVGLPDERSGLYSLVQGDERHQIGGVKDGFLCGFHFPLRIPYLSLVSIRPPLWSRHATADSKSLQRLFLGKVYCEGIKEHQGIFLVAACDVPLMKDHLQVID